MVVKITRIAWSGDTKIANKCIKGTLWQRLKQKITKCISILRGQE